MLRKPMSRSADGLTAYWVNRPISLLMSRYLVNTPFTPNHVTTFGLILGLLAAWFVSYGTWLEIALGGILLQVSSIIDGVDGELARMRLTSSHSGEWFDTICDDVINLSFLSGLGYATWSASGEQWIAYYTAGVVAISLTGVTQLYLELIRDGKASHNNVEWSFERGQTGPMTQVMVGFSWIAKRDTYTLLLMCLTVANLPGVTFWIMSVGALIVGGYTILEKLMGFAKAPQD
jgi:phosphatidylglycerophosphate synthase